jgi:outer membrane lipoprotein-sorting protein
MTTIARAAAPFLSFVLVVAAGPSLGGPLHPPEAAPRDSTAVFDDAEIERIIRSIDELYRSESSYSEIEMQIVTPHWERTLSMKAWTSGMEKTFIRLLSPPKERGVATLRIGNEMWNYLPRTDKVIKIPPSMMMSSWMGSDFTNDDLVKEFSLYEDYSYERVPSDDPGRIHIRCVPREDLPVVWGHVLLVAREEDDLPVREEYYDENGELMRILNFREVTTFDGRKIPAVMEMVPQQKEGHRTVIRYRELRFDVDLDEDVFSLRNLRSSG